ncbi:MAG: hypothetical protein FJ009_21420 [Chloroflexi bacterium]|nr:hypothetical protein [Chloroflexota bacterium]
MREPKQVIVGDTQPDLPGSRSRNRGLAKALEWVLYSIGLLLCLGIPVLGGSFLLGQDASSAAPVASAVRTYFNESIKPQEYDKLEVNFGGRFLGLNQFTNPVSEAEKANGVKEKLVVPLQFIYRESQAAEWKDAAYTLWLEKRTDWKVVKAERIK